MSPGGQHTTAGNRVIIQGHPILASSHHSSLITDCED